MCRTVEKYLEDALADELLRGNIKQGDTLDVDAVGEQLKVNQLDKVHRQMGSAKPKIWR